MRSFGILAAFAFAAFALSGVAIALPAMTIPFSGSGGDGGFLATVEGTVTLDPAAKTITASGVFKLFQDDTLILEKEFSGTATLPRGADPTIKISPIDGVDVTIEIVPGEGATTTVAIDLP